MRFSAIVSLLLALWSLPVCAQEGGSPLAAVRPYRLSGAGTLASERVTMELGGETCRVSARYVIRNASGYESFLRCGIPSPLEDGLEAARLLVDGLPLPLKARHEQRQVIQDQGGYEFSVFIPVYWKEWNMRIDPGESREVDLEYTIAAEATAPVAEPHPAEPGHAEPSPIAQEFAARGWPLNGPALELSRASAWHTVRYNAPPDSSWHGQAEASSIVVMPAESVLRTDPPPTTRTETELHWTLSLPARMAPGSGGGKEESGTILVEYADTAALQDKKDLVRQAAAEHPESRSLAAVLHLVQGQAPAVDEVLAQEEVRTTNEVRAEDQTGGGR